MSLNISNHYYIQQPNIQTGEYSTISYKSISHASNPIITRNITFPLNQQNIPLKFNRSQILPITTNNYIKPVGSRIPLEKDHHPFTYKQIKNNNINNNNNKSNNFSQIKEVSEFNIGKTEKTLIIMPGTHYEISQYVDILRNIVENIGTDEDLIVTIIENTNNKERQLIRKSYNQKFNEDIITRFQKELNGDFKESVIGSFMNPTEYDCYCLHSSLKIAGIRENVLTEIIGSRNISELQTIRKFYSRKYGETLKNDIAGETYGDYQKLLIALLRCQRSTSSQPNTSACANDASDLYQLGEKKRENDEETYIRIFTKSSPTEITIINHFYKQQTGKGLLGAIDTEFDFSNDTKNLLDTIVRGQVDVYGFYAKKIHEALENIGTNNMKLIRNICARYTIDLQLIKNAYERDYDSDMLEDIKSKLSGNFSKVLYSIAFKQK